MQIPARFALLVALVTPLACGSAAQGTSQAPAVEPARKFYDCPDPKAIAGARAHYEQAVKTLAGCDELCRKTKSGGFRVSQAMAELGEAARDGDRDAQALYGTTGTVGWKGRPRRRSPTFRASG
jgi:hypothetical protein